MFKNYYSVDEKKNERMPFVVTWMDLEIITLSKSDREKQISYHLYVESKKRLKKLVYKTDVKNKLIITIG